MKILTIDIGMGTSDILLYDEDKNLENCIKMVLPSPTTVLAEKVRDATRRGVGIFLTGETIGGGPIVSALMQHLSRRLKVVMTEEAAYTVRSNLEEVLEMGVDVIRDEAELGSFKGETIEISEVNINSLKGFLGSLGESLSDVDIVAVAVQDHGAAPKGVSNRKFRMETIRVQLERNNRADALAFSEGEIPPYYLRMKAAAKAAKRQLPHAKVLVMDTGPAALVGCRKDPRVERVGSLLAVNVGNGHTVMALLNDGEVKGLLEHHTRLLTPATAKKLILDFEAKLAKDEEVFSEGGHGVVYLDAKAEPFNAEKIAATGPNRGLLYGVGLDVCFPAPAGDVMMTGPMGLVTAAERKFNL
ncbi:MAG: DUF1786 family protein [Candidatus Bathyarchaeia archaeon]